MITAQPKIGLFVTCLVDLFRPTVGFSALKLLEEAGCVVEVPVQTCCGQPAYNTGDRATARTLAQQVITAFESFDYVVAPSGSCAGMIKCHYPSLFEINSGWRVRAEQLSTKTFELTSFLTDVLGLEQANVDYAGTVTYHDSCSGLRELGVKTQPRRLLGTVAGLELREMEESEVCCGFGGTFCVKYPELSNRMVSDKVARILATGADTLLAGDLGCLLNIAGKLERDGVAIKVRHVAEVLAGLTGVPALGEAGDGE